MKNEKLQSIANYLLEQEIEFKVTNYGNPYYYGDGFFVPGIIVNFDFDLVYGEDFTNMLVKKKNFLKFVEKQKSLVIGFSGKCGIYEPYFCVFDRTDYKKLMEHQNRIRKDTNKFWEERNSVIN